MYIAEQFRDEYEVIKDTRKAANAACRDAWAAAFKSTAEAVKINSECIKAELELHRMSKAADRLERNGYEIRRKPTEHDVAEAKFRAEKLKRELQRAQDVIAQYQE